MRLPVLALALALPVGLLASACTPMASPSPEDRAAARVCFLPQTVVNFTIDRDTTAYVRAGRNQVFELQSGGCRGLGAARSISLSPISSQGSRICVGDTVGVTTAGSSLTNENNSPCRAQVVRQLSEAEIAALPSRLRP